MSKIIRLPEHESANCRLAINYAWNSRTGKYDTISSIEIWSYSTHVASYWKNDVIENGKQIHKADSFEIFGYWSATTAKHIRWAMKYIAQVLYGSKWGEGWIGDCSKAKTSSATVYNPVLVIYKI